VKQIAPKKAQHLKVHGDEMGRLIIALPRVDFIKLSCANNPVE
jgi:hypothetical protein